MSQGTLVIAVITAAAVILVLFVLTAAAAHAAADRRPWPPRRRPRRSRVPDEPPAPDTPRTAYVPGRFLPYRHEDPADSGREGSGHGAA